MAWTLDQIRECRAVRKPSGHILVDLHDGQGFRQVGDTIRCCHCQQHFVSVKGSGRIRGHCTRCNAMTCGAPACDPCRPWEAQMEHIEQAARGLILP